MFLYEEVLAFVNIPTVVLLLVVFVLACRLLNCNKESDMLPPGPRGWPIVGSVPYIEKESYLTFDKWGKKYGGFYMVSLGWTRPRAVFLTNYVALKCVLKDQADKVANRFAIPIIRLGFTIKGGIVFENGPVWSERRRWTFGALRNLSLERNNLENRIQLEADYLCQEIDKYGESFNPVHCVTNAVSNIICTLCFGDRFEYNDSKFKELITGIRYIFEHTTITSAVNFLPFLYYTPVYRHFRKTIKNIKAFIDDEIHQHQDTFNADHIRDVIDAYIVESKKKDVDMEVFPIDLLWRTLFDIFFAGTDTTTCTIMWIILYLVNYPEVHKKVQREIDNVLGQGRKPTWSDRHSMPFLEATIMEVQRVCNAGPLFGRSTAEEINIKGYKIPAGTSVITSVWSIHHDSDQWERPLDFEPERFLSDDQSAVKRQDAFMPFGAGRRVCIGELMARMELFIFTANLMQRFTFKAPEGEPIRSVDECVPGLTRHPKSYKVIAIKR